MLNKIKLYSLVNYFDVWGNDEDGYEVNNISFYCNNIPISDDTSQQDILDMLVKIGFLTTNNISLYEISDNADGFIEIFQADNLYPLCSLREHSPSNGSPYPTMSDKKIIKLLAGFYFNLLTI